MRISLLTDAPKHNLALMKISAYHKTNGDEVFLNLPIIPADYTYASVLYDKNKQSFFADEYGGAAFQNSRLPDEIEKQKPDYSLFGLDYSLGYTFRPCYNSCDFCKVPGMNHPDCNHHSIYEFHNADFNKICLLNNNTFQDSLWHETFKEFWKENLIVIDENGYDIRLLTDEKAAALKKTKFSGQIHFAWDRMQDESVVLYGFELLKKYKISATVYVLTGYNTTLEQDIYRCQKIIDYGLTPYIMPYVKNKKNMSFKRFIDTFMWRKFKTVEVAFNSYSRRGYAQ